MAAPSTIVIDSGETFRLRNDHPTDDLVVTHGKRKYSIGPGKTGLVPFEVIRVWWGDPRSRPNVFTKFSDSLEAGHVNKREAEIARLGVMYGSYVADVDSLNDPEWPPGDPRRGVEPKRTPWPVTVTTEGGQVVVPACFDRTSEAVYGSVQSESADLNDQVQYQQHVETELDRLREELRRIQGRTEPDDTEVDVPGR